MENSYELNRALFDAVVSCKYEEAQRLLESGADPLGSIDETEPYGRVLSELFCEDDDNESLWEMFPKFVELFYMYGMDIATVNSLPDDDGHIHNPLWCLAFCQSEAGLKILHTMLEHGLDYYSAEEMVDHILLDMEMADGCHMKDKWWVESVKCGLKMVMLAASYPHVLNESKFIRECVELDKNDAQKLPLFRNWNDFDYDIDTSTCTNIPDGLRDATVRIKDPKTHETVWTLYI